MFGAMNGMQHLAAGGGRWRVWADRKDSKPAACLASALAGRSVEWAPVECMGMEWGGMRRRCPP